MVTVFNVDNTNSLVHIHRPDINYQSDRNSPTRLVLRSNNISMGPLDFILPASFKVTIYEDWDTHENHILAKLSDENSNLSLINVIVDKYLLYNIVNEKDTFLLVGEKVFYLENPDLMLYRTDNIPESHNSDDNTNDDSTNDDNTTDDNTTDDNTTDDNTTDDNTINDNTDNTTDYNSTYYNNVDDNTINDNTVNGNVDDNNIDNLLNQLNPW
jgi:hypothetical protein